MTQWSEKGSVLVEVMGLTLVAAILATGLMWATTGEGRSSNYYASSSHALALADAGIEYVFAQMTDADLEDLVGTEVPDWDEGEIKILDIWDEITAEGDRFIHVLSQGTSPEPVMQRTVLAVFSYDLSFNPFENAVTTYGDGSKVEIKGTATTVVGNIHSNNNVVISGHPTTVGSITAVRNISVGTAGGKSEHYYEGVAPLPNPSEYIHQWRDDAIAADQYRGTGDLTLDGGVKAGVWFVENGGIILNANYNLEGYAVFVARGDITLNGTAEVLEGYFYSIEGDILVNGNFMLYGAVAAQEGDCTVTGNQTMIYPSQDGATVQLLTTWGRHKWLETGDAEIDRGGG